MTAIAGIAWVLNLDAEFELIGDRPRRSPRMTAHLRELASALRPAIESWSGVPAWILDPPGDPHDDRAVTTGDAWCPTPRALALLASHGATVPPAPSIDVLRTANHRAFSAGLELDPEFGAVFCTTSEQCRHVLAQRPTARWLLKRPLGFSGRMRKVVVPRDLDLAAQTWIDASMTGYGRGLMVEPWVDIELDCGLHGRIEPDGGIAMGPPMIARCSADGAWLSSRPAQPGELDPAELQALTTAFATTTKALQHLGYFGPLNLDAFRWRDDHHRRRFRPLVELNARYSMAWFTAMRTPPPRGFHTDDPVSGV